VDTTLLSRFIEDLVGRLHGPLTMRLWLQPLTAAIIAARDGWHDARADRPFYLAAIYHHPENRRALLREGWRAVARVLALGAVMDGVYQLIVLNWIHPLELVIVVLGLAFVPYLLMRGAINRAAKWWMTPRLRA
jgi:hypothetical protein